VCLDAWVQVLVPRRVPVLRSSLIGDGGRRSGRWEPSCGAVAQP